MKDYKYIKKEIPNPQVKGVADQFYDASELLWEKPPGSGVLIPAIVNSVFSIELFLKSLISNSVIKDYTDDGDGGGGGIVTAETEKAIHKLSLLFDEVETDIAESLEREFKQSKLGNNYKNLKECLLEYDSTFVKVRYVYEDSDELVNTNIDELRKLAGLLHKHISNLPVSSKIIK